MSDTVVHTRLHEFFGGRVFVDEVRQFEDDRGFLAELWRTDDRQTRSNYTDPADQKAELGQKVDMQFENEPQMCYYSHTKPLVMRGPHEHADQTDWFVTLYSKMVYMFVYNNEVEYFVTEPDKVYRLKVEPGVIHSYRNLELERPAMTANFPSSLFMGVGKQDEIDEIRHEDGMDDNRNIYVLGAGGRLGKAMVDKLMRNMGKHEYNVIPVYEKFDDSYHGEKRLKNFFDYVIKTRADSEHGEYDTIINCMAKSNVQSDEDESAFDYVNFKLPSRLTQMCSENKIYFVQFSTDYVYQTGDVSPYTSSKKKYEDWLESFKTSELLLQSNTNEYIKIVRLANLFSQDVDDTHNLLNKIYSNCTSGNTVNVPDSLVVLPTDVALVADYLVREYIFDIEGTKSFLNLSGHPYDLKDIMFGDFEFSESSFDMEIIPTEELPVVNNPVMFLKLNHKFVDCDAAIKEKVASIKNS